MIEIPVAENRRTSYENFVAECPWCRSENIFNRASDLETFEPISGRNVSCQNGVCGKSFRIFGDLVNSPHEMLILDCRDLLERKHYMNAVLNLAQAYEMFFSLFFRVELLYKPFSADSEHDLSQLNSLAEALWKKTGGYTFHTMRALFLHHMVSPPSPINLTEAADVIVALHKKQDNPNDVDIERIGDLVVVPLLKDLKATTINTLRNDVVHKQGYRPRREEAEAALHEAWSILFPLTSHLGLNDDINSYRWGKAKRRPPDERI